MIITSWTVIIFLMNVKTGLIISGKTNNNIINPEIKGHFPCMISFIHAINFTGEEPGS